MTPISPRIRIYFGSDLAIGPGRIELLEGVQRTGSLAKAARDMDMSYRRAWLLMRSLNEALLQPATIAAKGGRHGGGASVTAVGKRLIAAYRQFETKAARDAQRAFGQFAGRRTGAG